MTELLALVLCVLLLAACGLAWALAASASMADHARAEEIARRSERGEGHYDI